MDPNVRRRIEELRGLIGTGGLADLSDDDPVAVGPAYEGVSTDVSRSDHVHAHGDQLGGTLHAAATTGTAGFMSTTQVTSLNKATAGLTWINVKDAAYGAVGDGVTDDTTAIGNALNALSSASGVLYFPPGTYLINVNGIVLTCPDGTIFQGAGRHVSIIKAGATISNYMMQGGTTHRDYVFQDLTFDGGNYSSGVLTAIGVVTDNVTFRRCSIQNVARFVTVSGMSGMTIEDCWSHGGPSNSRTAINLDNGCRNIYIRRNQFLYWGNSIIGNTASGLSAEEEMIENVHITDNLFDGAWTMRPSLISNSGVTVSYTATDLTDSAGGFTAAAIVAGDTIRALVANRTSTFTSVSQTRFTNTGATFVTGGIYRGDIVRSGTKWAYVSGVESETAVGIEGWLDSTTYLPVASPSAGGAFTLYKMAIGQVTARTNTVLSVARWFNTDGSTTLPAAQTLYEVCGHPAYCGVHFEYGSKNVHITRNTFLRSWGDQISYYGNRGKVEDNIIRDGMDVGITINGTITDGHNSIRRNTCIHAGSMNIWVGSSKDNVVSDNICIGGCWTTNLGYAFGAGIVIQGCSSNVIERNLVDGENLFNSNFGICLAGNPGAECNNNIVRHNIIRNVLLEERAISTAYALNDRRRNGNKQYYISTAGTTGVGAGPVGFLPNEADGTAAWYYAGANAEIIVTGDNTAMEGNRIYDNDTELPVFHYNNNDPTDPLTYAEGAFSAVTYGAGAPEGVVTAGVGTVWVRNDGTAGIYKKGSGTGSTGWLEVVDLGDVAAAGVPGIVSTSAQTLGAGTKTVDALVVSGDLTVSTNLIKTDDANNRVGINVTSPNRTFVVAGSDSGNGIQKIRNTHASGLSVLGFDDDASANKLDIGYGNSTSAFASEAYLRHYADFKIYRDPTGSAAVLAATWGNSTGHLKFESGGFIGLGIAPTFHLHASGTVAANGHVSARFQNLSAAGNSQVAVGNSASAFAAIEVRGASETTTNLPPAGYAVLRGNTSSGGVAIQAQGSGTSIEIWTNVGGVHAKRAEITSAGAILSAGVAVPTVSSSETQTNKTFTNPTINAAALSGTVTGTPTFSQAITFTVAPTIGGLIRFSNTNSVTAFAGGGQASATALTTTLNYVTTVATPGDSVKLPTTVLGIMLVVFNTSANACDVFPTTGAAIDGLATNAAYSLAAGASREFYVQGTIQWRTR